MKLAYYLVGLLMLSLPVQADGIDVWDQLLPESERQMALPEVDHNAPMDQAGQQNLNVSVNKELDGKPIRIPGFIVPLDSEGELVTEFLLVPYFGACLHYPPPPPNQIVYVTYKQGLQLEDLWEPVWVEGTINTQIQDVEGVATVGYSITEPQSIVLYTD
ncbi:MULTISPECIES: DUF3299 domain-containing protein [unclassified Agarivorans]|uniref:DUF3299 domain-containing protein n=1 Tax=unclassified Agarivorans TaxID=2636026 RepID=UPI0010DB9998|nr:MULTISPECIES: DUF3299 domain-containing protein [unclassified Agarivorans]MDO6764368.1 DUF3299 domain-containing protein [Agarivorans sp. 1_MG-2023]GDY27314.1 hypothetical protein AHAT_32040 [Agarivorans sp. Toyoura001]